MRNIILTLLAVSGVALTAGASEIAVLEDAFHVHSNLYKEQADRFMEVRDKVDAAIARYTAAIRNLDEGLATSGTWTARKLAPGEDAGL